MQDNGTSNGASDPRTDLGAVTFAITAPTETTIARPVDFNADGIDDLLWRNADGSLSSWIAGGAAGHDRLGAHCRPRPKAPATSTATAAATSCSTPPTAMSWPG